MTEIDNRIAPHPPLREYYPTEEARRRRVDGMFDASAGHYDWINSVMSLGSGEWYRRQALARAGVAPGMRVLDVGSGTGVVAAIEQDMVGEQGLVVALDPSRGMLAQACDRGVRRVAQGLGENLPFRSGLFDRVSMSYALRHVGDLRSLFEEFARVLQPGGQLLILEITRPRGRLGLALLAFYMKRVVPTLTRVFRRSPEAQELMQYYWDTIETCVPPETIMQAMQQAGLERVERQVTFGIFSEYRASRPVDGVGQRNREVKQ